jgi:hypothetical protein
VYVYRQSATPRLLLKKKKRKKKRTKPGPHALAVYENTMMTTSVTMDNYADGAVMTAVPQSSYLG